ncbi:MAG: phage head morphogenesis protein, partial [Peptostreptococcus anaerobius]|nr:phage head morphogenesis protein [Peptostreptococcus anaerobius]MDU0997298.1 phage head morphogenesis protein [Peptostreptococcus anaerobius]
IKNNSDDSNFIRFHLSVFTDFLLPSTLYIIEPYFCVNWGATRDKKDNKIYVPKDMTYPKFHKKYIESDKEYSAVKKS